MEIRVLNYFLAVAQEESISAAADFLHITQPTLSRQIMELEEEVGAKLFIRGRRNRKVTLTEEGVLLRKRAEEIVALAWRTKAELAMSKEEMNGDIFIGGGETDAMRLIAKAAKELQKEYPRIRYHLFSGNANDVGERLEKGLLDFGIMIEPASMEQYDYIHLPAKDRWGLLMKKDSPLAQKENIRREDLMGLSLLGSGQTMVQNAIAGWFGQGFEKLEFAGTYNLIFNASLMVEEGFGYALCLDKLVNTTGDSALCFRPLFPPLEAHLHIVWKKYRPLSKVAELFLNRLQIFFSEET